MGKQCKVCYQDEEARRLEIIFLPWTCMAERFWQLCGLIPSRMSSPHHQKQKHTLQHQTQHANAAAAHNQQRETKTRVCLQTRMGGGVKGHISEKQKQNHEKKNNSSFRSKSQSQETLILLKSSVKELFFSKFQVTFLRKITI